MFYGELSSAAIDAELANLLADVEAWLVENPVEAPASEAPAPVSETPAPDAPATEAPAVDAETAEAPAPGAETQDAPAPAPIAEEDLGVPDFAVDGLALTVGQSLAGTEFVFIF